MTITVVLVQMIKLFLIMCLGGLLYKIKIIDDHTRQHITKIVIHVTTPALIVHSFIQNMGAEDGGILGNLFIVSAALYILLPIAGLMFILLLRVKKAERGLYMFISVYSNVGFMGFPVVEALYGHEGLFYAAVFNCVFNISVYTIGVFIIRYGNNADSDIKKTSNGFILGMKKLLTPGILCCVVAVVIFLSGFELPEVVIETLGTVGGLTSPLAMMLVGASLASMNFKEMFGDIRMYIYTFLRQFLLPVAAWPLIDMCISNKVLAVVTLLMVAMPVGNIAVLFSTEYKADEKSAARAVFLTTIAALFSIPAVLWLCVNSN